MKYSLSRWFITALALCLLFPAAGLVSSADPASDADKDYPPPSLDKPDQYQVDTTWGGIVYQVIRLKRIQPDRMQMMIRVFATSKTQAGGYFLGTEILPPKGTKPENLGKFLSKGVSLLPTVMTDDLSQVQYPAIQLPNSFGSFPSFTFGRISAGFAQIVALQFPIPPPPPPPSPGQTPKVQTLSFLIPRAVGPITHVPIPPPDKPAAAGAAGG